MRNPVHFISGLPRSGSTLLAGILRQNPACMAGMSGPAAPLFMALETAMSRRNETAVFLDSERRQAVLRGLFDSLHGGLDPAVTVFDTNRTWCAKMPALAALFPQAKVICCVRNPAWVLDSLERLHVRNPWELSGLFGYDAGGTVYSRATRVGAPDGLIGFALNAVREACFGPHADRLILLDYDTLARAPGPSVQVLYKLLGLPAFDHDFSRVEFQADEFDQALGTPGLHAVRRRVTWEQRPTVLPPDLFDRFAADAFWLKPHERLAAIPAILA